MTVHLTVNGEVRVIGPGMTVADLVAAEVGSDRGVAVAVNAELVPRSTWAAVTVAEGDRVEVLRAAQGG
jgi:sulfur carrier protein